MCALVETGRPTPIVADCITQNNLTDCPKTLHSISMLNLCIPQPQPLASTDLITVSVVLPFLEYHTIGSIQHKAFTGWLLSLCNLYLFFLIFSWFISFQCSMFHFLDILQFIHLPTEDTSILVASNFDNYKQSCYKHGCAGFLCIVFNYLG